jgi:hypothetical protein
MTSRKSRNCLAATLRGLCTIALDDGTVAIPLKEKEKHRRIGADVADGADVALSLLRLFLDERVGRGFSWAMTGPLYSNWPRLARPFLIFRSLSD